MIVTSIPVSLNLPPNDVPRSPGIHQSGIIRAIATEAGILKPEWEEDVSLVEVDSQEWWRTLPEDAKTRICMGLAWEQWYIPTQLPEVVDHPGEMLVDGVYMTPDGEELTTFILDTRPGWGLKLHEVKLTYKSINTVVGSKKQEWRRWDYEAYNSAENPIGPLTSQWMWLAQTKGYCRGAGTRFVDLHVLFVCGDYSYPQRPIPYRYSIEFTQQEIDDNWELMTQYRDHRVRLEQGDGDSE